MKQDCFGTRFISDENGELSVHQALTFDELRKHSRHYDDTNLSDWKTINKYLGEFKYFGTFHFAPDFDDLRHRDEQFEDAQKDISHFKNIISQKLFGRENFELDFLSVIEQYKWNKKLHRWKGVKTHFHFLISDAPDHARVNKDFKELLIDCWCSLKNSDSREEQQVKLIYHLPEGPNAEEYICKLRHSPYKFLDEVNSVKGKSNNPRITLRSISHQLCSSN